MSVLKLRPLVICGPSGAGKGTIIKHIMTDLKGKLGFSVSHTTRKPREGEENGTHYHFTTVEEFEKDIKDKKFVEYAKVHNNYYGTSFKSIQDVAEHRNEICILDIDIQGCKQICKTDLNPLCVFITAPSIEELKNRLENRGTETKETLETRLNNAIKEIEESKVCNLFNHTIVNNEVNAAVKELKTILNNEYSHLNKTTQL
mmetsp:Transcript_4727/g.6994  ORF Transcript_4727/g.6994 Transcript_4727/m.6994 type:complete len:202 (+) Transcript_4727:48-653(+)